MASSLSAGILLYRYPPGSPVTGDAEPEVLLVHPGGPMWARRDLGAWSIPKGEVDAGEEPLAAARREFAEETGSPVPEGEPVALGEVRLKSGKRVLAWALAGDLDAAAVVSNTFEMQWPPRSGRMRSFPEVDRAQWFSLQDARARLNPAQAAFVDRVADILDSSTT
jgi:predicted NUDIX family NTP pyrophosphohydrolase